MLAVNESHLENGLRVVTVEQPHLHSACVSLFVNCGSRHEANVEWGLSHLLEHMLFRSSERFPDKVARALERYGGSLQAATWRDHTQLWTPIHPSRLREALALLGEMVSQPRFQNLEVERNIVEAELQQDLDEQGRDTDINNISRASIWHGHPMGRRIAGSFETLRSFDVDDVHAHHAKHYVAGNSVLCVAGKVRHQEVEELARRAFTGMRAGERTHNGAAACFVPGSPLYLVHRDGPQLDIQLTFEALPDQHRDFAALSLLTRVLDDGSSSRLQNAICERRGLVYELTTGLDCYADCGLYDIEMRVSPRRAASAVAATLETIAQLCTTGISDDELELARERSLHEMEFSVDSAEEVAVHFGASALFGNPQPLEKQMAGLSHIQPGDLLRVAREMFLSGRAHVTVMGPVERANLKKIEKLLSGFPPRGLGGTQEVASLAPGMAKQERLGYKPAGKTSQGAGEGPGKGGQ